MKIDKLWKFLVKYRWGIKSFIIILFILSFFVVSYLFIASKLTHPVANIQITDVKINNEIQVNKPFASIEWNTNVPSVTSYRIYNDNEVYTYEDKSYKNIHKVTLLLELFSTNYDVEIIAKDMDGNAAHSTYTFISKGREVKVI